MVQQSRRSMAEALNAAKLAIFDNDGVTYRFTSVHNNDHDRASARAAASLIGISYEQALQLAQLSRAKSGSSSQIFYENYGVDKLALYRAHHELLDISLVTKCDRTPQLMANFKATKAILTHGSFCWTNRVLPHVDLKPFFSDDSIFDLVRTNNKFKNLSSDGVLQVCHWAGVDPCDTVFFEDTPKNLEPAKELGVTTFLITRGQPHRCADYPYVDYFINDLVEPLRELSRQQSALAAASRPLPLVAFSP